jgi:hypothetical protein
MKQTPLEDKITKKMQAGVITLNGFLGTDERHYHEIIETDEKVLLALSKTAEQVADRMEYFTKATYESFMGPVIVDKIYEVETEVTRGKLQCPFGHPGIYRKSITSVLNKTNNLKVRWTALNIHLIREHHFFEGTGSPFRLEPDQLAKVIF